MYFKSVLILREIGSSPISSMSIEKNEFYPDNCSYAQEENFGEVSVKIWCHCRHKNFRDI